MVYVPYKIHAQQIQASIVEEQKTPIILELGALVLYIH
jgi:hypothetical protein